MAEHSSTTTVAEPSAAKTEAAAEPSSIKAQTHKRPRQGAGTADSSEEEPEAGPLWQVGCDNGYENAIWWRDCAEPFQTALGTQYQLGLKRVTHLCRTPHGRDISYRHNLEKILKTNLNNCITKMLRMINAISVPLNL